MLVSTKGIVLRQVKYGDTSLICTLFTAELGVQSYIINGARSARGAAKANMLRPMSLLQLVVYHKDGKQLQRIREMSFDYLYQTLLFDVVKGAVGLFLIEVLSKVLKEEGESHHLYDWVSNVFVRLDKLDTSLALYPHSVLLELAGQLGFGLQPQEPGQPWFDMQEGVFVDTQPLHPNFISGPTAQLLANLLATDEAWETAHAPSSVRRALLGDLLRYFELHVEGFPRIHAHAILESVFR